MPDQEFEVQGSKLIVNVDLEAGREEQLRAACAELLDSRAADLVVDLSKVRYIHSLSVGMLSYAWVEALSRDKEMKFLISQPVFDVLERTGLSKVFRYEVTG
jgi:anti-anti-sigma factor